MITDVQDMQEPQSTHDEHTERFFNLLDEPWVLACNKEGVVEELSVLEVFRRAHELKCLEGELPTQDVAILRFLLAILYAVFTRVDENGEPSILEQATRPRDEALRRWKALWDASELPVNAIERYLEFYRERFWLVHPTQPFYQVAGLRRIRSTSNNAKDASQIISDVPSRIEKRFFTLRSGSNATELSYPESARWLIALHAWDYAGKKAVVTDPSGNCGSENGGGTGWLGKLGVVYFQEASLAKTLLMNFVLLYQNEILLPTGLPIWEEEPRNALKLEKHFSGFVELLTQQSRRVLLSTTSDKVTGATISYGDVFNKENLFIEQMSSWHKSSKSNGFIPTTHEPETSLWRDLTSLLPYAADSEKDRVAGIIDWAQILKEEHIIDTVNYNIAAVGIKYGDSQSVVHEIIADELTINASLFTELGESWAHRIVLALDKTDECVSQLGKLARKFTQASGKYDDNAEKKKKKTATTEETIAQENAYHAFDSIFRRWLASVNPETDDLEARILEWQNIVLQTIKRLGQELFDTLGTKAIIGPIDQQNSRIIAAPIAFIQFKRNVNQILKSWKEEAINE